MTAWFTSDHHFGHANIIEYTHRPFSDVNEMDSEMIRRWNERVGYHDTVYHLGDFTLCDADIAANYFGRLYGTINILGNRFHHDRRWLAEAETMYTASHERVTVLDAIHVLELTDETIVLCHYPIDTWDRKHYGAIHLHGHTHRRVISPTGHPLNVCVEQHNFYPISLDEVIRLWHRPKGKPAT